MASARGRVRISIYVDEAMRTQVKMAVIGTNTTVSGYCAQAIREKLRNDGLAPEDDADTLSPSEVARRLDALSEKIGPIGIPVSELVNEGRYR